VTAQLIDATSGAHIWADRFDGAREDVFELQDRLTEKVVAAIAPKVEQAEIARSRRKPSSSLDAYDWYLRGLAQCLTSTKEGNDRALDLFRRAIALDPEFASAYGMATWCYTRRKVYGWFTDTEEERAAAMQMARAAVRLGQDDALALSHAAFAFAYVFSDLASAKAVVEQAVALNPNLAAGWATSGWINLWLGDPDVAADHFQRAMRLSPVDVMGTPILIGMAFACFYLDRHEEGVMWANRSLQERPDTASGLRIAAACAAFAGMDDVAREMIGRLRAIYPGLRLSTLPSVIGPLKPEFRDKFFDGLRRAGLPE
jgi:adenylate cyclase